MEQKTLMEFEQKILNKIQKTVGGIKKINEKTKGYNFEYTTIETIIKTITPIADKNKLFVHTSPNWVFDLNNEHSVPHPIKEGKEFVISGIMQISLSDLETGYTKDYFKLAAGKGADPGQAVGAAETYALRQFLNKTFSVEVEREDQYSQEKVYVFDSNGDTTLAIEGDQILKLSQSIAGITGNPDEIRNDAAMILSEYNKKFGTNYSKLKNEFPSTEFEQLYEFATATLRQMIKLKLENKDA